MSRPVGSVFFNRFPHAKRRPSRRGYTLVELLVATALTLILMGLVVQIFGAIGQSVADSRAALEMADRLRSTAAMLQMDLANLTVKMDPPVDPASGQGYAEIIEGPIGPMVNITDIAIENTGDPATTKPDTTVGDLDDVLMFTVRSSGKPFLGRCDAMPGASITADTAEVAWFVRGKTLYRRVMLIAPGLMKRLDTNANGVVSASDNVQTADGRSINPDNFYNHFDISVHYDMARDGLVLNTLSDLTRRECRFAHDIRQFPFDVRGWGPLGLPTLRECSSPAWQAGRMAPMQITPQPTIDFWNNPCPWPEIDTMTDTDNLTGFAGPRVAEDVVLSNVIGFDVKVWSPWALDPRTGTQGAYVDLGYGTKPDDPLASSGHAKSYLPSLAARGFIYDTWSTHYEHDGIDQDQGMDNGAGVDQGTNGFDDVMVGTTATNGIDDVTERETMPPYPVPLRGIQVKIRSYEPTTRQIRETTVVQDFLPK